MLQELLNNVLDIETERNYNIRIGEVLHKRPYLPEELRDRPIRNRFEQNIYGPRRGAVFQPLLTAILKANALARSNDPNFVAGPPARINHAYYMSEAVTEHTGDLRDDIETLLEEYKVTTIITDNAEEFAQSYLEDMYMLDEDGDETGDFLFERLTNVFPYSAIDKLRSYTSAFQYIQSDEDLNKSVRVYQSAVNRAFLIVTDIDTVNIEWNRRNSNGLRTVAPISDAVTITIIANLMHNGYFGLNNLNQTEKNVLMLFRNPAMLYGPSNNAALLLSLLESEKYQPNREQGLDLTALLNQLQTSINPDNDENIRRLKRTIDDATRNLIGYERDLNNKYREYLLRQKNFNPEEITEYFKEHPYITKMWEANNNLVISFVVPLSLWDPELLEMSKQTIKEQNQLRGIDLYKVLEELLINNRGTIRIIGRVKINLSNLNYSFDNIALRDSMLETLKTKLFAIPNPHIQGYSCTGSYAQGINKAQQSGDIIGLLESLMAPYKNWNIADGVVLGYFIRDVLRTAHQQDIPFIDYENEIYTIKKYYETFIVKEEETESEGNVNE